MKRPTVASRKTLTPENLANLGAERLAEILMRAADGRAELKRQLRMELAAAQGAPHLLLEIDKRIAVLETGRSKISWRQRPTFVRDLDILRILISERLAALDAPAALQRLWPFMALARRLSPRVRDPDGGLEAVFDRAAEDIGALMRQAGEASLADDLAEALVRDTARWTTWLPLVLDQAPQGVAKGALARLTADKGPGPIVIGLVRQLADAAGNIDIFQATFSPAMLRTPAIAAELGRRLIAAGRLKEAGERLKAAKNVASEPDFAWESVWIDYLDQSGQEAEAQAVRWASFERTLSVERARAFTRRLTDFQDVEAEGRAFDHAARHPDFPRGLRFLMDWPALPEAARMIETRADEIKAPYAETEAWAARLRVRQPKAALLLLRKTAAAAFARRDLATCERLTQEADSIEV
ncbi:MAG: hypothetical protein P4L64_09445 [Caulobacteraceae bacterium]|nr:hypothetical protein [Caulobacteraceae bacterium]